jgi:hypothetical protein
MPSRAFRPTAVTLLVATLALPVCAAPSPAPAHHRPGQVAVQTATLTKAFYFLLKSCFEYAGIGIDPNGANGIH